MNGFVKVFGVLSLVCLGVALSLTSDLPRYLKYQKGDIKEYETVAAGELKAGDLVQGEIDFCDGCIAEYEETSTTFGIETSKRTTSQYYAVYMYNDRYIIYQTSNQEHYNTLNKLTGECEQYYESLGEVLNENGELVGDAEEIYQPTTTLAFTAIVKELPNDLEGIFREWYGEGFDQECETLMMTYLNFDSLLRKVLIDIGAAVLGIVFLVLTIVSWRKSKRFRY